MFPLFAETFTMLKEQAAYTRAYLIKGACDGLFTEAEVAKRLGLTTRRVQQIKRTYREIGDKAFVHGNKGRPPARKMPDETRKRIIDLKLSDVYLKANFAHFTEILGEMGIKVSYTTIRNIMRNIGHKSPKSRRRKKDRQAHPPRPRRECYGEMLQADASPFDWFGNGEQASLHGFIDDATGTITGLFIEKNECLLGYLEVVRQTVERYGIPAELYPDKASVFFVNQKERDNLTVEEQLEGIEGRRTQLGLIMDELGVDMHPAHSPQAKGRVERLWETLQSRLPIEFRRRGITTIGAANDFLNREYMTLYNKEFAISPADNTSKFIRLFDTSVLDAMLVYRVPRRTDNAGVFQFHNHKFIIPDPACRRKKIELVMSEKIGFKARLTKNGTLYEIQYCDFFDNKHIKSHIPDVTKTFINRYLKSNVKETTRRDPFLRAW
jgi:transposase